ncbi:hypothetical protein [Clostridium celatum]|uniref:Uncharacterized protein n=1 Tax=Clostridium celatum DSM 1785 TaxID=545697 RepID=L1QF32_9CLOT|nr:hypothetical protein [Clostridium celatum]EKY26551.1 hypothetical protein HMPREF0216_01736 [Clostridium celatum DSM 1785]
MLLTEIPQLNITINDLDINFKFNFKIIENLYYGLSDKIICKKLNIKYITPLQLLEGMENYNEGYFILLLHASADGRYSIDLIKSVINNTSIEDKQAIYFIIKSIIVQSLIYVEPKEDEDEKEVKSEQKKEIEGDKNYKEIFENWYNYYYTMSVDKLKMSIEEFYNATATQIKERVYRINVDKKNTYILAYAEVVKARGQVQESNKPLVEEVSNPWEFIKRI